MAKKQQKQSVQIADYTLHSLAPSQWTGVMAMLFADEKYKRLSENRHQQYMALFRNGATDKSLRAVQLTDTQLRDHVWRFITERAASTSTMSYVGGRDIVSEIDEEGKIALDSALKDIDGVVFLFDVIETIVNNANEKLKNISKGKKMRVEMFDGILSCGEQLRSVLGITRDAGQDIRLNTVFAYYADSIYEYIRGRMNTYAKAIENIHNGRIDRLPESLQEEIELMGTDTNHDGFARAVGDRVRLLEEVDDMRRQLGDGLRVILDGFEGISENDKELIVRDIDLAYEDYIKHGTPERIQTFVEGTSKRYKCFGRIAGLATAVGLYLSEAVKQFIVTAGRLHNKQE